MINWMEVLKNIQVVTPTTKISQRKEPIEESERDCCQEVKDFLNSEWRILSTNPNAPEGYTKIDAEAFTSSIVNENHNPLFNVTSKSDWNDLDCEEVYILVVAGYNYERKLGNQYTMEMGKYMMKRMDKASEIRLNCNDYGEISDSLKDELYNTGGNHMFNRARYVLNKWGI